VADKQQELSTQSILEENRNLKERLIEAEQTIQAIQNGEVDALIVQKPDGERLYTLTGADHGYRILFESITEGALILSSDNSIYYCNRTMSEMLQNPQKLIGKPLDSYVYSHSRPDFSEHLQESRRGGSARGEFLLRRNDGSFLPVNISLNGMSFEDFHGVCAVITDLTEQKKVEEELRRHRTELQILVEERTADLSRINSELQQEIIERRQAEKALRESTTELRRFYESGMIGVMRYNLNGKISDANDKFLEMVGYASEDLQAGRVDWIRMTPPEYRKLDEHAMAELKISGVATPYEKELVRKDGSRVPILIGAAATDEAHDEGVAFVLDFTARKAMEEELHRTNEGLESRVAERTAELRVSNKALTEYAAKLERLNEELQEFAFVASHDLQEPLRKIQTFGNMLGTKYKDVLPSAGQDYLSRMTGAANRMTDLLRSLLNYSRVTTQSNPLESVDLAALVQDVVSDLELALEKSNGKVEIGDLPQINADPAQIRQLIQNLIDNSMKFHSDTDDPVVKIHGYTSGGTCTLFIEDNGIGFEERYTDRIFRPFQQLHGKSENYGGTGMGLAICRKIVERHGGSITARSVPGQGSTFIVRLPISPVYKES